MGQALATLVQEFGFQQMRSSGMGTMCSLSDVSTYYLPGDLEQQISAFVDHYYK